MSTVPLVVGIDFSMTSTGIARSDGLLTHVFSKGKQDDSLQAREARLRRIVREVVKYVDGAELVLIEGPSYASKFGHAHDRSGGWWLLVSALLEAVPRVVEITPTSRMTYATGKGNAAKDLVLAETVKRYPQWDVKDNDAADALVLCAMGMDHLGHPIVELPQTHRRTLAKVAWPVMTW
jgi:crossover junction endodeoxyribonuclease RuvC